MNSPSYWQKLSSLWIDFMLLLGAYLLLGFISGHVFKADAYPPPGMQLYSAYDFAVYWFFVRWSLMLTALYLFLSYRFFGVTLGQKLVGLQVLNISGERLTYANLILRILFVLGVLLFLMVPGPVIALAFLIFGAEILNMSLSLALLLAVPAILVASSYSRYVNGKTRSWKDKFSKTIVVDNNKIYP